MLTEQANAETVASVSTADRLPGNKVIEAIEAINREKRQYLLGLC